MKRKEKRKQKKKLLQYKVFVFGHLAKKEPAERDLTLLMRQDAMSLWYNGGGGGGEEAEPPASRTLLSRFPYLYLPPPALFRTAPVPCKLAESKHILVI